MKLDVNATRMELLGLRRKTSIAKRGHKLLKDKEDELMRKLLSLVRVVKELRETVEKELEMSVKRFLFARSSMEPEFLDAALLMPQKEVSVEVEKQNLLNIKVPFFKESVKGRIHCYGFLQTSPELDVSLLGIDKVLQEIVELAEKEKTLELIASEIEKTRRRVNALEYILIPNLEETLKYILMKLSEMERGNLSRLMRIKDIIRK
jgi:V/A-type H+-transporting ATPase subunit D